MRYTTHTLMLDSGALLNVYHSNDLARAEDHMRANVIAAEEDAMRDPGYPGAIVVIVDTMTATLADAQIIEAN